MRYGHFAKCASLKITNFAKVSLEKPVKPKLFIIRHSDPEQNEGKE